MDLFRGRGQIKTVKDFVQLIDSQGLHQLKALGTMNQQRLSDPVKAFRNANPDLRQKIIKYYATEGENSIPQRMFYFCIFMGDVETAKLLFDNLHSYWNESGEDLKLQNDFYDFISLSMKDHGEFTPITFAIDSKATHSTVEQKERIAEFILDAEGVEHYLNTPLTGISLIGGGYSIDPNGEGPEEIKRSPFLLAVESGLQQTVKKMIGKGANPTQKDGMGDNALHICAETGNTEILRDLLEQNYDFNEQNNEGATPLHVAVASSHRDAVSLILEKQPSTINTTMKNGITALHLAAMDNDFKMVKFLLTCGADVELVAESEGLSFTALTLAVAQCDIEMVRVLLRNNANLNANLNFKDEDGRTPLHMATVLGNPDLIELLLKHGADPTLEDNTGNIPSAYIGDRVKLDKLVDDYDFDETNEFYKRAINDAGKYTERCLEIFSKYELRQSDSNTNPRTPGF